MSAGTTSVVVMGVAGSGKTTTARALADYTGWRVLDGDDLQPPANVAKMAAGDALDDADRLPWLEAVAGWIGEAEAAASSAVVACSALKRVYRDLLRAGHPSVSFLCLDPPVEVLRRRLAQRRGHFMPSSLLDSQLETLERLQSDERGCTVTTDPVPAPAELLRALAAPGAARG